MSIDTSSLRIRRPVWVRGRTYEVSIHVDEHDRWEMNGDETPLPVALRQSAKGVSFKQAQRPEERAYDADEVWYYSPAKCVFIIKGDTVVTVTPANRSSLDLSSLVQCETCEEWTDLRTDGSEQYRCAYCDSQMTTLTLPHGVEL